VTALALVPWHTVREQRDEADRKAVSSNPFINFRSENAWIAGLGVTILVLAARDMCKHHELTVKQATHPVGR
jgi:hypothetical protein